MGSGAVSGVLIFTVISALMGLVRAAYEEKSEYFASLTSNILRSAQRALDTIQRTNESVLSNSFILLFALCLSLHWFIPSSSNIQYRESVLILFRAFIYPTGGFFLKYLFLF